MYEAARLARRELRNQQDQLQNQRQQVQSELKTAQNPADIKGLEGRLAVLDGRMADVEKQLAAADAQVANRAAIPGVLVVPPPNNDDVPPGAMVMGGSGMLLVLLLPLAIAYARRIWRRAGQLAPVQIPAELFDRMASIERGVEAVAIEVERIGEGQRFVSQLLAEQGKRQSLHALPAEQGRVETR
jgi:hypothetical protein